MEHSVHYLGDSSSFIITSNKSAYLPQAAAGLSIQLCKCVSVTKIRQVSQTTAGLAARNEQVSNSMLDCSCSTQIGGKFGMSILDIC